LHDLFPNSSFEEFQTPAKIELAHDQIRETHQLGNLRLPDGTVATETAPRRFPFLLGPGETCRTAAGRLKELEGKETLTLGDLEAAFFVE
jgi:hypothetical protein